MDDPSVVAFSEWVFTSRFSFASHGRFCLTWETLHLSVKLNVPLFVRKFPGKLNVMGSASFRKCSYVNSEASILLIIVGSEILVVQFNSTVHVCVCEHYYSLYQISFKFFVNADSRACFLQIP